MQINTSRRFRQLSPTPVWDAREFLLQRRPLPILDVSLGSLKNYHHVLVLGHDKFMIGSMLRRQFSGKITYIETSANPSFQYHRAIHGQITVPSHDWGRWQGTTLSAHENYCFYVLGDIHSLLSDPKFNQLVDALPGADFVIVDYFTSNTRVGHSEASQAASALEYPALRTDKGLKAFFKVYDYDYSAPRDLSMHLVHNLIHALPTLNTLPSSAINTQRTVSPKLRAAGFYSIVNSLREKALTVHEYRFSK